MAAPAPASVPLQSSSISTRDLRESRVARICCISRISTANADLPSTGLSRLALLRTMASSGGKDADSAGTQSPAEPRSETAQTERRRVDFPAIFGPVSRTSLSSSMSFWTPSGRSSQYGHTPVIENCGSSAAASTPPRRVSTVIFGTVHPLRRPSRAWRSRLVTTRAILEHAESVAEDARSLFARSLSSLRICVSISRHASRYSCRASSSSGVDHRSETGLAFRSSGWISPSLSFRAESERPEADRRAAPLPARLEPPEASRNQTALLTLSQTSLGRSASSTDPPQRRRSLLAVSPPPFALFLPSAPAPAPASSSLSSFFTSSSASLFPFSSSTSPSPSPTTRASARRAMTPSAARSTVLHATW
mmetsp:Transcript_30574/g.74469  ORF Transcript_30574/g.74469 Transcript_30574/m.74469 type:complete len:364 (+) Transcript_30574:1001-2092(+)